MYNLWFELNIMLFRGEGRKPFRHIGPIQCKEDLTSTHSLSPNIALPIGATLLRKTWTQTHTHSAPLQPFRHVGPTQFKADLTLTHTQPHYNPSRMLVPHILRQTSHSAPLQPFPSVPHSLRQTLHSHSAPLQPFLSVSHSLSHSVLPFILQHHLHTFPACQTQNSSQFAIYAI
jgi:hypothetical protein